MKRFLIIIFSLLICLPFFVSCTSDVTYREESAESSSESVTEENIPLSNGELEAKQRAEAIDTLLSGEYPEKYHKINIARTCSYTFTPDPYKSLTDDGKKLTNSIVGTVADESEWVGFMGRKNIEITVDLGGLRTDLCGVSVNCLYNAQSGRNIPKSFELWVSTDGVTFERIAQAMRYPTVIDGSKVYTYDIETPKTFSASHVKLVLSDFITIWTLIDNVQVFQAEQDKEKPENTEYYNNQPMPEITSDEYWQETESDYKETVNLIKGLGQRIYNGAPISTELKTDYYNTPASTKLLTDGKHGGTDFGDSAYFHATKALSRSVIYDIGKLSALSSAKVGVYVNNSCSINYPNVIIVYLSVNGTDWQRVAEKRAADFPVMNSKRTDISLDFDGVYKARFVRFVFTVTTHVWLDELEAYGTKYIPSNAKTPVGEKEEIINKGFSSPESLEGCNNILLAYNYKTENVVAGRTTKDEYLPYVGYYDKENNLKDFFFDSYLYLPCHTTCPSGGQLFYDEKSPSLMSDWLDYENDLFYENANLNALEQAVGEVKTELGQDDYQVKVFLSVFNPWKKGVKFGDVDGDGIKEDTSIIADRKKIIKWWIDRQIDRYKKCGFKNQKLVGFYWYDEYFDLDSPVFCETINYALDYIHSLGYKAVWIPYYQAAGYTQWESIGFDAANMQPNYMFNANATEQVVYDNAELCSIYGMGVEIEICGNAIQSKEYHDRYVSYIRVGVEKGYMNAIKMYYQDAGPGTFYDCFKSSDSNIRSLYDLTYLYAKSKLVLEDSYVTNNVIEVTQNTQYKGMLEADNNDFLSFALKYTPKFGKAAVDVDGNMIYIPMDDYIGQDVFTVILSNGLTETEQQIVVNVSRNQ